MMSGHLRMHRIHPECVTHSATGRVGAAEPNIQSVPKYFCVRVAEDRVSLFMMSLKVCRLFGLGKIEYPGESIRNRLSYRY